MTVFPYASVPYPTKFDNLGLAAFTNRSFNPYFAEALGLSPAAAKRISFGVSGYH